MPSIADAVHLLVPVALCVAALLLSPGIVSAQQPSAPVATTVPTVQVNALRPHPRLFADDTKLAQVRRQIDGGDAVSRRLSQGLQRYADGLLTAPPSTYTMTGRRLLSVSQVSLRRIGALALVARLTDDDRYARRAVEELDAVTAFADWNPSHFLDTAEMTLAVSIGYDWLHPKLTDQQRQRYKTAIREKGLLPSMEKKVPWWVAGSNNWNPVCHAGLTAGALVTAEEDPELAQQIVARAVANLPRSSAMFAPDGACAEGPAYWAYGVSFHVLLVDMLQQALGSDFGTASTPGFRDSAQYYVQMIAPTGRYYNYADCGVGSATNFEPALLWFAATLDQPSLAARQMEHLDASLERYERDLKGSGQRLMPFALLWRKPTDAPVDRHPFPLHQMWRGVNPVSVHRLSWTDPRSLFVGIKGGSPGSPHAHMDGGSFILEADGVRWARDLGAQDYHSIEKLGMKLWSSRADADRWKIFRIGAASHNILRFDDADQRIEGSGKIAHFSPSGDLPHTVLDLSSLYPAQTTRVMRGVALLTNRQVLLQDEWTLGDQPADVTWQMLTTAEVAVDRNRLTLTEADQQLQMTVQCDDPVTIDVVDAATLLQPYDAPNPGAKLIRLRLRGDAGAQQTLKVLFSPGEAGLDVNLLNRPLAKWSAPL